MKKHNYRAQKVNNIKWPQLGQQFAGQALVFAVDVAKEQQGSLDAAIRLAFRIELYLSLVLNWFLYAEWDNF